MAIPNQKFREIVFQLLYSYDMGKAHPEDLIPMIMKELAVTRKTVLMAQERVEAILKQLDGLDAKISQSIDDYTFDQIHSVERNILRLGVFEILHDEAIPPKVAITEAIRLAKKFSTAEATAFINGVLDRIYHG